MTLNNLDVGKCTVITAVGGDGALRKRLLDLGLTPKTQIMIRKVAPLGDPIEVSLRGFELSLRKDEAALIEVQEVGHDCANCKHCTCR